MDIFTVISAGVIIYGIIWLLFLSPYPLIPRKLQIGFITISFFLFRVLFRNIYGTKQFLLLFILPIALTCIIYFLIPYFLLYMVEKLYVKHKNKISIKATITIRKIVQMSTLLIIFYLFYDFAFSTILLSEVNLDLGGEFFWIYAIVVTVFCFFVQNSHMVLLRCFQPVFVYHSIVDKLENYILYLRAFKDDRYEFFNSPNRLNEGEVVKTFKRYFPVYAIGQPNKLLPYHGAKRIYITEEEWQDGVKKISQKAKIIVLNISNTDNFLWETEFCIKNIEKNKLFFICKNENSNYYSQFQEYMNTNCQVLLPEYTAEYLDKNIVIYFENQTPILKSFSQKDDFQKFIDEFMNTREDMKETK